MFGFTKKTQVIKFEQNLCNANVDDNEVLFVRVSDIITDADAQLVVPITHNALLIKGGGDVRHYKSGSYEVFEDKKEIKNWKSGLPVEVVYIPKDTEVQVKWGTGNRITYRDKRSQKVVSVGARGEFSLTVINDEQFFRKVVGNKKEFNLTEFRRRFGEKVATEFADLFLKIVDEKDLTYDRFDANKKEIAIRMGEMLQDEFKADYGLSLSKFLLTGIDMWEQDKGALEGDRILKERKELEKERQEKEEREAKERQEKAEREARERRAEAERLDDKEWEREKFRMQLKHQEELAKIDAEAKKAGVKAEEKKSEPNICPNCKHVCGEHDKFCPSCGKRVSKEPIICPDCGKANDYTATFCSGCGKKIN